MPPTILLLLLIDVQTSPANIILHTARDPCAPIHSVHDAQPLAFAHKWNENSRHTHTHKLNKTAKFHRRINSGALDTNLFFRWTWSARLSLDKRKMSAHFRTLEFNYLARSLVMKRKYLSASSRHCTHCMCTHSAAHGHIRARTAKKNKKRDEGNSLLLAFSLSFGFGLSPCRRKHSFLLCPAALPSLQCNILETYFVRAECGDEWCVCPTTVRVWARMDCTR